MGKKGPCYHCGVTSTPLWRNGPLEKPVLCNACGSRWRTKGTLENYTPIHARTETDDFEDYNVSRKKIISLKKEEVKQLKRKQHHENLPVLRAAPDDIQGFLKPLNEDMSNRSSSGSAVSNSESCAQFGSTDASDLTGPSQSIVWDTTVPSRKRTCVNRPKQSSVEKLTKDLYTILHEQSSYISKSSEEDLIFESNTPMVSVEIGHGSVLIRHPSSIAREEESEASSLSVENKPCPVNEMYSCSKPLPICNDKRGMRFANSGVEIIKKSSGLGLQQEQIKREKFQHENFQYLGNHDSPLQRVDLTDVVNFEEFVRHLSNEEQQLLLKYLPPVDTGRLSNSLKSMFDSFQFKENLSSFQQLLAEGVFDTSSRVKTDDCKNLKLLALGNLTKSKWVEQYNFLKICRNNSAQTLVDEGKNPYVPSNVMTQNDCRNQNFPEGKARMRSPKRVLMKASCESKEAIDHDCSCFSPRSLFSLPPDGSSLMLDSSSDQDLLLDVPFNGSFPQAELLNPASSSFHTQTSATSSTALAYPWQCS